MSQAPPDPDQPDADSRDRDAMDRARSAPRGREPDVGRWPGARRLALIVGGSTLLWAMIIAVVKLLGR